MFWLLPNNDTVLVQTSARSEFGLTGGVQTPEALTAWARTVGGLPNAETVTGDEGQQITAGSGTEDGQQLFVALILNSDPNKVTFLVYGPESPDFDGAVAQIRPILLTLQAK